MSIALTFIDKDLLKSTLVGAEGAVQYTTSTTSGFRGRKVTTITAASGLVGTINWRAKTFDINGVERGWHDLKSKSGGIFSSYVLLVLVGESNLMLDGLSEREWNWGNRPYLLKYHDSQRELLVRFLGVMERN